MEAKTIKFDLRIDAGKYMWLMGQVETGKIAVERTPPRCGRKPKRLHQRYMKLYLEKHIETLMEHDTANADAHRD